jgi:hypothetical protein
MQPINCRQARWLSQHSLDQSLPVLQASALEAHVAQCPACAAQHGKMSRLHEHLETHLPSLPSPPAGLEQAVLREARRRQAQAAARGAQRWHGLRWAMVWAVPVALILAMGWLVYVQVPRLSSSSAAASSLAVHEVIGQLQVQPAGQTQWQPTTAEVSLKPGDLLRTLASSRAYLRLGDWGEMRLDPDTVIQWRDANRVALFQGLLWVQVKPGPAGFTVKTPGAELRVVGTEFLAAASRLQGTWVLVLAGQVMLCTEAGEVSVPAGHEAAARAKEKPPWPGQADLAQAKSWAGAKPAVPVEKSYPVPWSKGEEQPQWKQEKPSWEELPEWKKEKADWEQPPEWKKEKADWEQPPDWKKEKAGWEQPPQQKKEKSGWEQPSDWKKEKSGWEQPPEWKKEKAGGEQLSEGKKEKAGWEQPPQWKKEKPVGEAAKQGLPPKSPKPEGKKEKGSWEQSTEEKKEKPAGEGEELPGLVEPDGKKEKSGWE